ncbi:MAG: energy transducer TonB [Erythrobacter sp.]|uniref:energy transducer TonB n=1 Tax=Erythrobacter sp. TaxID=1042 RepID=UPI00329840AC
MRIVCWSILATIASFGLGAIAHANKEPVSLKPSSPWSLDYGETKCRLVRGFGEGDDKHYLILDQHFPSRGAGLTVAGPEFRRFRGREETIIGFSDNAEPRSREPLKGDLGDVRHALIFSSVYFGMKPARIVVAGEGAPVQGDKDAGGDDFAAGIPGLNTDLGSDANYLSLTQKKREVRFETGPLAPAFEALNSCTNDMVTDWGFDVEKQMTVAKRPAFKNVDSVAGRIQKGYPNAAVRQGVSAILRMRVTIDENGNVEECFLNGLTNTDRLKSTACSEMYDHAEFDPALDIFGRPIRSFYTTSITYRIR